MTLIFFTLTLNQKIKHSICILILTIFHLNIFAQEFKLKILSKKNSDLEVLEKIDYQKKHIDSISLKKEILKISDYLQNIGYFTNNIDSLSIDSKTFTLYFSLNEKLNFASIKTLPNLNTNFIVPIRSLKEKLNLLTKKLEDDGKSFSKLKLTNIKIKKDTLFADLKINQSKKRKINKIITKGYKKFPEKFIKNYLGLKENILFRKSKMKEVSEDIKSLSFVSEIKKPEILFTKDSTLLYIYLKKEQNNSFEGLINFTSKENGNLLINGNINLKLENILNTGELFKILWNSIGEERQEFKIATKIPYFYNSRITPDVSFSIYKEDSTFINTTFNANTNFNINKRVSLGLSFKSETSEKLNSSNISSNVDSFNNQFLGVNFNYSKPLNDSFYNHKILLEIKPSFGKRESNNKISNQLKLKTIASYLWDINMRNYIYIKNEIGFLNSDNYLKNELFRVGGANSIRGFNEQSIFTKNYTFFNLEYRYLTSEKSYLYTITDFGTINSTDNVLGLGLGYLFNTNNSQINLSLSLGKQNNTSFNVNSTKLGVIWTSFF